MLLHGKITKNVAWEVSLLRPFVGWLSQRHLAFIMDFQVRMKGDHRGLYMSLVLFSATIFEINIYGIKHQEDL